MKRPRSDGQRVIDFIETYCIIPEGEHVGRPLRLAPFQKRFIKAVYDNRSGTRRAYLSIARKNGKGLALDTPIPTPSGWRTMGDLAQGDTVFDERGQPCRVAFVSPVHIGLRCWRVTFSDGTSVVADEQHRWLTTHRYRPWAKARINGSGSGGRWVTEVVTTPQIAESVRVPRQDGSAEHNHAIAVAGALDTQDVDLPLDPYLLGCWLGDGDSASGVMSAGDEDVGHFAKAIGDSLGVEPVTRREKTCWSIGFTGGRGGRKVEKFQGRLRALGLLGDKHIPDAYLWAGAEQRRALLQGLMDTDGTITPTGLSGAMSCEYTGCNRKLVDGVLTLVRSLGIKATIRTRDAKLRGRVVNESHHVQFTAYADDDVFRLPRKRDRLKGRPATKTRSSTVKIESCEEVPSVPTRCIQVDSPSRLFLAGEGMTPTHNTGLIAGLVLAHLVGPRAVMNGRLVSGARSRDQAAQVFELAAKMVKLSPKLSEIVRIVPSGKRLVGTTLNTEFQALAADGTTAHGLSPVLAILDEVGQVRGPKDDFVDAITTSQGAHAAPLLIAISTQAASDADLFSLWLDDADRSHDPHIVSHVYKAPEDCALDDRKAWSAANPALGLFRSRKDLAEQAKQAARMPASENTFRWLCLNQRIQAHSPFVSRGVWESGSKPAAEVAFEANPVYAGLDLSARQDLTALVMVARDADGVWHVRSYFWAPAVGLTERARRDRAPYDQWQRDGYLEATPGASVDYDYVAARLGEIAADCDLRMVAYDRWRIDVMKKSLDAAGLQVPLEPFGQGFKDMSPALDTLEAELVSGRVLHGGNPVLTWCASNAIATRDPAGNRKLDKSKATGRIDGMVALAMAMGAATSKTVEAVHQPGIVVL